VAAFEYPSVLISIILALGMTRVLGGVVEMLQARSHQQIYWVHTIWIINLFLYLVIAWWIFYRWLNQQPWTFLLFVFVLISPTILYLASLLLFPRESDVDLSIDYKTHYYANHRAFFILFGLFTPVDIADSLLKGVPHFLALGRYISPAGCSISQAWSLLRSHATSAIMSSVPSSFSSKPLLSAFSFFKYSCKRAPGERALLLL
jgi:hypothetical protein